MKLIREVTTKMNFDLEYISCNLCGNRITIPYASVSYMDYISRRPELKRDDDLMLKNEDLANCKFNLVKCKSCGLIYVNPRLTGRSLADLYHEEYFSFYVETSSNAHKRRQKTFKTEIAELERMTEKLGVGRKILDVGCGGGFFLSSLDDSWEKYGTEVNSFAAKYARDTFRINVLEGRLREVNFPDGKFDIVKLRGAIEHLPDPIGELREIHRILRKGGLIAVNTPNIGSICGRLYKEKFRMVCPTHHIYYFSTRTLSLMLKKVGFKVRKFSYHYFDTPYASWKDLLTILLDIVTLRLFKNPYAVSPPFYGNILDIYAVK